MLQPEFIGPYAVCDPLAVVSTLAQLSGEK